MTKQEQLALLWPPENRSHIGSAMVVPAWGSRQLKASMLPGGALPARRPEGEHPQTEAASPATRSERELRAAHAGPGSPAQRSQLRALELARKPGAGRTARRTAGRSTTQEAAGLKKQAMPPPGPRGVPSDPQEQGPEDSPGALHAFQGCCHVP